MLNYKVEPIEEENDLTNESPNFGKTTDGNNCKPFEYYNVPAEIKPSRVSTFSLRNASEIKVESGIK